MLVLRAMLNWKTCSLHASDTSGASEGGDRRGGGSIGRKGEERCLGERERDILCGEQGVGEIEER